MHPRPSPIADGGPRILFLGCNRRYLNPTTDVLLRALRAGCKVDFFGPGYSNRLDLDAGPARWIDRQGPYDFVMADSTVLLFPWVVTVPTAFSNDVVYFDLAEYARVGGELHSFFQAHSGPKLVLAAWDYYGLRAEIIDLVAASNAYILDFSMMVLPLRDQLEAFGMVFRTVPEWPEPNDNWYHFLKQAPERFISTPHAIGLEEFSFKPPWSRRERFVVPGTGYHERREVRGLQSPQRRFRDLRERAAEYLFSRLPHREMSEYRQRVFRNQYISKITNARTAFCSGSVYVTPVRKYFEIPALGTAPIGWRCTGFGELGFTHGENFLVAESSASVAETLTSTSDETLTAIADRAQDLVWAQHTATARAAQIISSLERILAGSFRGSYWLDGRYCHRNDEEQGAKSCY